jgi:hypothetical protein
MVFSEFLLTMRISLAQKHCMMGGQSLIELNALNSKLCLAEEDPSIDKRSDP